MKFYNTIFKQSWTITRDHKVLWLFGLFVLFLGGRGIDFELFFSNVDLFGSASSPFRLEFWQQNQIGEYWSLLGSSGLGILIILLCIVSLLVLFGSMMFAEIGIVDAYAQYARKGRAQKKEKRYSLGQTMEIARDRLLSVAAVNVLGKGLTYGLLALIAVPVFFADGIGTRFLSSLIVFFLVTPLSILISMLLKYTVNFIVLGEMDAKEALQSAWKLFRLNLGVSIEFAVVMFFLYFAVNVFALVIGSLITLPVLFFGLIVEAMTGSILGLGMYYIFLYFGAFIALVITAVLFSAWHYGSWTVLFLELTKGAKRSKIDRLLKGE